MSDGKIEGIVQRVSSEGPLVFTEAALAAQDGKKVPVSFDFGPIIGEATLKYDPEEKALKASFQVDDPKMAEFLRNHPPSIFE